MPTVQTMKLPIPQSWQEFESIVRDAQGLRWNTSLQKNGRLGQTQQGVDIWGTDEIGRRVGIQCKRYNKPLTLGEVMGEIGEAEKFEGGLSALFLATTTDHDSKLQAKVRMLSDQRVAQGKFAVGLLFWDEIVAGLMLNPQVFKSHYPQLQIPETVTVSPERLIAALDLGYYGADLQSYLDLVYGEFGQLAQEDPDGFLAVLRVLEGRVQLLLPPEYALVLLESLRSIREGCLLPKNEQSDWHLIEFHAKRVSARIMKALSLLPLPESKILNLGLQLGMIYHHADDVPEASVRNEVEKKVRTILPSSSNSAIIETFTSVEGLWGGYQWANRIFSLVEQELRFNM
jgi:hypothetical protein